MTDAVLTAAWILPKRSRNDSDVYGHVDSSSTDRRISLYKSMTLFVLSWRLGSLSESFGSSWHSSYLQNGDHASELSDKLDMSIVASTITGDIAGRVVLVDKVIPADVHP